MRSLLVPRSLVLLVLLMRVTIAHPASAAPADRLTANAPAGDHPAQVEAAIAGGISAPAAGEDFGHAVAGVGDVTRDGRMDVAVGAPLAGADDAGAIYVFAGGDHAMGSSPAWSASGSQAGEHLGWAIASRIDVNGDGIPDLVVGAPGYSGSATGCGRILVYLGSPAGLPAAASQVIVGSGSGAAFGFAV